MPSCGPSATTSDIWWIVLSQRAVSPPSHTRSKIGGAACAISWAPLDVLHAQGFAHSFCGLGAVMGRGRIASRIGVAVVFAAVVGAFSGTARATWFDSATGQPVHAPPVGPPGSKLENDRSFPAFPTRRV
jgi:hypothetical protein